METIAKYIKTEEISKTTKLAFLAFYRKNI